jgi:hypothetical protein
MAGGYFRQISIRHVHVVSIFHALRFVYISMLLTFNILLLPLDLVGLRIQLFWRLYTKVPAYHRITSSSHQAAAMPSKPHPLRRISTNSLTSLARSQSLGDSPSNPHTSPSQLSFLAPALQDLVDESASLAHNIKNLSKLHDALGTFNDSFAAYLYALKMNAFCVDWKEGPDDRSFKRMDCMGREFSSVKLHPS